MICSGPLYLAKTRPQAGPASNGVFVLNMLAHDRISRWQTEPWRLIWSGPQAADWWAQWGSQCHAGTPLGVEARRLQVLDGPACHARAEIMAQVISLRVLPTAAQCRSADLQVKQACSADVVCGECY